MRERGYAQAVGEREPGLTAIAAPIRSARGELEAIVALQGPSTRFDGEAVDAALPLLLERLGRDLARAGLASGVGPCPGRTPQVSDTVSDTWGV